MGDVLTEYYGMNTQGAAESSISSCSPISRSDLSSCHRCGLRFPSGSIDQFHILESQWRIVLLCYDCLDGVRSARVCSYCFLGFPESEKALLVCVICSCRVHSTCVPLHHRNFRFSEVDTVKFMCVDCCPVKRFWGAEFSKSRDSTSQSGFNYLLEDMIREKKSFPEKKMNREGKARKNLVKNMMVVRGSTEVTEKAEGAVQLGSTNIKLALSDEQLALRLHRSINGSQRISRDLSPKNENSISILRKLEVCNFTVSRNVDSNSCCHHSKVQVCSENRTLFVDRESFQSSRSCGLFGRTDEELSKKIREHNTEGLANFSLKEREVYLESSDSTGNSSYLTSILLPFNSLKSQVNNNIAIEMYRSDVGEGSSKIQQRTIDAASLDRYKKQYFRRRLSSKSFIGI